MNEMIIQNFIKDTEEYLRINYNNLSQDELEGINELYQHLNNELMRQQMNEDLLP